VITYGSKRRFGKHYYTLHEMSATKAYANLRARVHRMGGHSARVAKGSRSEVTGKTRWFIWVRK